MLVGHPLWSTDLSPDNDSCRFSAISEVTANSAVDLSKVLSEVGDTALRHLKHKNSDFISIKISDPMELELEMLFDGLSYGHQIDVRAELKDGQRVILGTVSYKISPAGELDAFVEVPTEWQGAGVSHLFLPKVLLSHPEISSLKAWLIETNEASFATALALELDDLAEVRALGERYNRDATYRLATIDIIREEALALSSKEEVIDFRNRVLNAFNEMTPAGRTRKKLGYSVQRIEITLDDPKSFTVNTISRPMTTKTGSPEVVLIDRRSGLFRRKIRNRSLQADGEIVTNFSNP